MCSFLSLFQNRSISSLSNS